MSRTMRSPGLAQLARVTPALLAEARQVLARIGHSGRHPAPGGFALWREEEVAVLIAGLRRGASNAVIADDIARLCGTVRSRNAVIGYACRHRDCFPIDAQARRMHESRRAAWWAGMEAEVTKTAKTKDSARFDRRMSWAELIDHVERQPDWVFDLEDADSPYCPTSFGGCHD